MRTLLRSDGTLLKRQQKEPWPTLYLLITLPIATPPNGPPPKSETNAVPTVVPANAGTALFSKTVKYLRVDGHPCLEPPYI